MHFFWSWLVTVHAVVTFGVVSGDVFASVASLKQLLAVDSDVLAELKQKSADVEDKETING